jgi:integrase
MRWRSAGPTRHAYATTALMAGVQPAYIAQQLGHGDMAMPLKHYSKWIVGAEKGRERDRLDAAQQGAIGPRLAQAEQPD